MREGRPSETASLVAFVRALADEGLTTARGFSDPVAPSLLPRGWSLLRRLVRPMLARSSELQRTPMAEQLDVIPLRVLAIDAEVERAIAAGCRQLVILGAGLDTRAFRMRALAETRVFEVDHPHTQAFKRRRAAALQAVAQSVAFVPVDFERDPLHQRLKEAGHRADAPTFWIWEGVVMYLTTGALRSTLDSVSLASAPGSSLCIHYHEPGRDGPERHGMRVLLRLWSEPQIGDLSRQVMAEELHRVGFEVARETGTADWALTFGAHPPATGLALRTRLVVARKG